MKKQYRLGIAISITLAGLAFSLPSLADASVRTTTVTTGPLVNTNLTNSSFVAIDPLTGVIKGSYDPTSKLINGTIVPSGLIIENRLTGKVESVVDANGNIADVTVAPVSQTLLSSLNARRAELEGVIAKGLVSGEITPAVAASLRADLNRLQVKTTADKVTYIEAIPLATDLDMLSNRIVSYVHTSPGARLIDSRLMLVNGQLIVASEFESRRSNLSHRIDDEYAAGRLSSAQVGKLKAQLGKVSALAMSYSKNGIMTERKSKIVLDRLNKIQTETDSDVAIINKKRSKIGIKVS